MELALNLLQIVGSLGLLLYGMKLMSDGIQKSAGDSLHSILNFMTGNRFMAVLTGIGITALVQSSGATTVMTVTFVNAGLLSLTQAIGVIFGANIGTTVTAWLVSIIGFSFNLTVLTIPVFGLGYFLTFLKRLQKEGIGEAIMGLALLFMGLDILSHSVPSISPDQLHFVQYFMNKGFLSLSVGVLLGLFITIILHSSSAATAIILTLSYNGILTWEFAAAMVLGSNIGTTFVAVLVSIGAKLNARRAATVHVLFNVTGTILAMIFFRPFLSLVEMFFPGGITPTNITAHLAMLHTIFNVSNTILFIPFVTPIARFVEYIIKPGEQEPPETYTLVFPTNRIKENAESYVFRAEREILGMSEVVRTMFSNLIVILQPKEGDNHIKLMEKIESQEQYADQMQEELTRYLVHTSELPLSERTRTNVRLMLQIVDDLESMTDEIFVIAMLIQRSKNKKLALREDDMDRLTPYLQLAEKFLQFVHKNLNKPLSKEQLAIANDMENEIDKYRKSLKKIARKRLEKGANVKAELLYIDIVRTIEKIGDHAFSISETLAQTR